MQTKKTNTKEVVKTITELSSGIITKNTPREIKMAFITNNIDPTKYTFMGFGSFGATVRLMPRFYNVRDRLGRFTNKNKRR